MPTIEIDIHVDVILFPTAYLDLLPHLNGHEFKILAYLLRHMWPSPAQADGITLEQICQGTRGGGEERIDYGTGINIPLAVRALAVLVRAGLVERITELGLASIYSLAQEPDLVGIAGRLVAARLFQDRGTEVAR